MLQDSNRGDGWWELLHAWGSENFHIIEVEFKNHNNSEIPLAFTIHRNITVRKIEEKWAERPRGTREIVDPNRAGLKYQAVVATFDGISGTVGVADFYKKIKIGDRVSVAINNQQNLIALVNHSKGTSDCLKLSTTRFSDFFGILFFISIPALLSFFIARLFFQSEKDHNTGYFILGFGLLLVLLILAGVGK